ncbi:hypothetical protein [Methylotuvimicrobium sp. KM1]|uniref:hypothetical protein n=1 Tax=Methylotuvimicrobium sp. KM1 TaxID=3377707 RepID=UPI00384C2C41
MKIEQSNIQLNAQQTSIKQYSVQESLNFWVGNRRPDSLDSQTQTAINPMPADRVTLSSEGKAAAETQQAEIDPDKALEHEPRYQIIKRMIEALTGKEIRLSRLEAFEASPPMDSETTNPANAPNANRPAGFGLEYERRETYYEAEHSAFSAKGLIKTTDGKEIAFDLNLVMSREYYEENSLSLRMGDAVMKDPLVINFDAEAAKLTDMKFSFDLTSKGSAEQISFVGHGSGFLALDRNSDGIINNGSELFGPATGNGFAELATHDLDGNQWIDENDAVYERLRIWTKDTKGNDKLYTLAEKNIGAIYLGNTETSFELKNAQNRLDGRVLTSSIYLSETGRIGTVQQIDLAV